MMVAAKMREKLTPAGSFVRVLMHCGQVEGHVAATSCGGEIDDPTHLPASERNRKVV